MVGEFLIWNVIQEKSEERAIPIKKKLSTVKKKNHLRNMIREQRNQFKGVLKIANQSKYDRIPFLFPKSLCSLSTMFRKHSFFHLSLLPPLANLPCGCLSNSAYNFASFFYINSSIEEHRIKPRHSSKLWRSSCNFYWLYVKRINIKKQPMPREDGKKINNMISKTILICAENTQLQFSTKYVSIYYISNSNSKSLGSRLLTGCTGTILASFSRYSP